MVANQSNWKFQETPDLDKEGHPTADACATEYRRWMIAAGLLSILPSIGCGMSSSSVPNKSVDDLAKMIRLPSGSSQVLWELVTLPEGRSSDLPGPTDYVCLIAVIYLPQNTHLGLSEIDAKTGIQKSFVRPWLPKNASTAIKGINPGTKILDVKSWVIRKHIKSYGIPIPEGLVLYVEYISPQIDS